MQSAPRVILASASPRRTELLAQIGVPHRVVPARIDESRATGESIEQCTLRLAAAKAVAVHALQATAAQPTTAVPLPVLGADTVVALGDQLFGKPRDREHAFAMWQQLAGRVHEVWSAVAVASASGVETRLSRSEVRLRALSAAECAAYWDSAEPRDKAGGYAIQGLAAIFVTDLRGSYSGVMGLPLYETAELLSRAGVPCGPTPGAY